MTPARVRQRHARRRLHGGRRVEQLHAARAQDARELVGAQALAVHRHAHDVRLAGRERERGAEIARLLHHDGVAGVDEQARDQIDRLLRAVHHHDASGVAVDAPRDERACDRLAQRAMAAGVALVGEGAQALSERARPGAPQLAAGQGLGIASPRAEVEARRARRAPRPQDRSAAPPRARAARRARSRRARGRAPARRATRPSPPRATKVPRPTCERSQPASTSGLVGLVHGVAREPETLGEIAAGRQALARQQPPRFDQPAQVGLELAVEGLPSGSGWKANSSTPPGYWSQSGPERSNLVSGSRGPIREADQPAKPR